MKEKCPTCESPAKHLHPAMQFEGEVQPCKDSWHNPHKSILMKSYIICLTKYAAISYGLYELTQNGTYTIARAFSGRNDRSNVQALLDLIIASGEKFELEVRSE